jgi:serine/threonine protein kinase
VIHRDIKPDNIIRRQRDRKPVLIDFGIAKQLTETALLRTGTAIGSQEYVAPEQARGKAVPASDLYSLGVTCIRLLTGVSPLEMYDFGEQQWCWRYYLPQGKSVSDRLGQIIDKLLQAPLNHRYQDANQVLQDLYSTAKASLEPVTSLGSHGSTATCASVSTYLFPYSESSSIVAIDYTKLRSFLKAKQWEDADRETWALMCGILGKSLGTPFQPSDIEQLPCLNLQTINDLWLHYSQGRFGLSVQKQIYESVGRDYERFCDRVNWSTTNAHTSFQILKLSQEAPEGHLPSWSWIDSAGGVSHAAAMAEKLKKCGITP